MLKTRYQLLLAAAFVLIVYSPATFSGFSRIDDTHMVELYRTPGITFSGVIFANTGSHYYRPVPAVSYLIDQRLLDLHAGAMHVENVLIHVLNTILVFFLTRALLRGTSKETSLFPFIASLLFGLHPINSESVNWISGRTDLLAGVFVLSSALFLVWFIQGGLKRYLVLAGLACFLSLLTKEVAYAFLPGALLLLLARDGRPNSSEPLLTPFQIRAILISVLVLSALVVAKYFLRGSPPDAIRKSLAMIGGDRMHAMFVLFRAFGFYLKKLIIPHPLNLYIQEIDPLYQIIGIPLSLACLTVATRRTLLSATFTIGILMILPSLIIVFNAMAWSPFAERYLYLPSAFVVAAITASCEGPWKAIGSRWKQGALILVLVVMAVTTFQRSNLWRNEAALLADAIEQSPKSVDLRLIYGNLLLDSGDPERSLDQFKAARNLSSGLFDARPQTMIVNALYKQGRIDEALAVAEDLFTQTNGRSLDSIDWSIILIEEKLKSERNAANRRRMNRRLLYLYGLRSERSSDPAIQYRLGSLSSELGDRKAAARFFQAAADGMKDGNPLKDKAMKEARRAGGRR